MRLSNSQHKEEPTVNRKLSILMNKTLLSLGLVTTFATPFTFALSAHAVSNDPDPVKAGCLVDAQSLIEPPPVFGTYQDGWGNPRQITVKLMLSKNCKSNWVAADVPKNSYIYLADKAGKVYVQYQAQVNGWNYTDRADYRLSYKACVKVPNAPKPFCTEIVD